MSKNLIIYAVVSFLFISRASCQLIFRRSLINCPALKFLQFQQCIMELTRALFSPSSKNKKKSIPKKKFLYFRKWNFLALILTKFLYFRKRRLFLYVQKWNPALFSPDLKNKNIYSEKNFLYFRKLLGASEKNSYVFLQRKLFLYFRKRKPRRKSFKYKKTFYISGKETFLYFEKGIFRTLAYLELEAYSEPWYIQNPRHIQNSVNHLRWNVLQKIATQRSFLYSRK